MKVLIDIPTKEFGVDIADNFQDFFKRLEVETKSHLVSGTSLLCGAYELETIEMFLNAFKEIQIIPDNATNGDMIKAMFPNAKFDNALPFTDNRWETIDLDTENKTRGTYKPTQLRVYADWWNALYK